MKKLLMGSCVLLVFAASIILVQLSCNKKADAQQTSICSETATVIFDISFPSTVSVSTSSTNNGILISTEHNGLNSIYNCAQWQDFRSVGTAHQKNFTFKGLIPGSYKFQVFIYISSSNSVKLTSEQSIDLVAGQTYNIKINDTDFK